MGGAPPIFSIKFLSRAIQERGRPGCEPRCRTRCAALPYEPAADAAMDRGRFSGHHCLQGRNSRHEEPRCRLERISLDLSDGPERRKLFAQLNARATKVVVATEGLLIYFSAEEVASLAADLAAENRFQTWIIDLASPGQLRLMQRTTGKQLSEAGAAFKFGPPEGVNFFAPYGWEPTDVQGMLKTAAQFNRAHSRTPLPVARTQRQSGNFPWTGVCLLNKREPRL